VTCAAPGCAGTVPGRDSDSGFRARLLLGTLLLAIAAVAAAGDLRESAVTVSDAWIREPPPGAAVSAAYLSLRNDSGQPLVLLRADSARFLRVEIHASVIENDRATMQRVDAIAVAPGESLDLRPGGYHLMLFRPVEPLRAGDRVVLQLHFDDGSIATIAATVRGPDAGGHADHH
jgi:copper(I)-binding protein